MNLLLNETSLSTIAVLLRRDQHIERLFQKNKIFEGQEAEIKCLHKHFKLQAFCTPGWNKDM